MSEQYPGGFINKTAPTLNPALGNAAPGIWNMTQVQQAVKSSTWPGYDPYYKNVTLNLHGNGTNGAQNNTFLDSSTNNFTITRNGNTTQGTFSPYGSNWSNNFNGSTGYLTVPSSSLFKPGSSDFTIEAWVFVANTGVQQQVYGDCDSGTNNGICLLAISSALKVEVDYFTSSTGVVTKLTTGTVQANTWNHICVSKTGTTMYIGYNGTLETFTGIPSTMQSPATIYPTIARLGAYNGLYVNGYISNFRYVIGSAVYTGSTYTVPTTPLTAISGTSILTCQSNRFIDNSTNALTITVNGSPSVQRFSPFSPTTAYSTSVIGGSGYFDGSGDYLNTPTSGQFAPTGDFTVSFWYYPTTLNTYNTVIGNYTSTASTDWFIEFTSNGSVNVYTNGSTVRITGGAGTIKAGQWSFVTLSRSGTTITFKVNGTSIGTYTQSGTFGSASKTIYIGQYFTGSEYITGYLSDVRLIDGSEVTTIPTSPLTAVSGTNLLLNFTNAGILDNAMMNDLETVGNAQISTSVYKYGTGSMSFDGTDDRLVAPASPNIAFGTGDFTVEAWIYPNVLTGERGFIQTSDTAGGLKTSYTTGIVMLINVSPYQLTANVGGTNVTSSVNISASTWTHVALTRSSGSVRLFVNGALVGGPTTITTNLTGQYLCVGGYYSTTYLWNGYIDDLRITKGYARYTVNFTPPTSQLQDQ